MPSQPQSPRSVDGRFESSSFPDPFQITAALLRVSTNRDDEQYSSKKIDNTTSSTPLVYPTPHGLEWWRTNALAMKVELEKRYSSDKVEDLRREIKNLWYWKTEALAYWKQTTTTTGQAQPSRRKKTKRVVFKSPWEIRQSIDAAEYWEIEYWNYQVKTGVRLEEPGISEVTSTVEHTRVDDTRKNHKRNSITKKHNQDRYKVKKSTASEQPPRRSSRIANKPKR